MVKRLLGIFFLALPLCQASASPIDTHYCKPDEKNCSYEEAYGFLGWDQMSPQQIGLLHDYLQRENSGAEPRAYFPQWTDDHDDRAASFLAMTLALSRLKIITSILWAIYSAVRSPGPAAIKAKR